ncbi:MAG: helix-turn-helix transcriptional regulator [Defluviitaleaceae bacterium]|nr:helix-turn-helix transcriptional regulator [Defluviitaleaceae bacterium]MCL2240033.1 helix-turn-helix transcriptional regulator [Defluviitaleaceae bacterium]
MTKAQQKAMATRIKRRRESLGFTQESFSEVIDLSASSYTKIENAFQKPALDTLINIANHLDLSLDYIVFGVRYPAEARESDLLQALLKQAESDKIKYVGKFLTQLAKTMK